MLYSVVPLFILGFRRGATSCARKVCTGFRFSLPTRLVHTSSNSPYGCYFPFSALFTALDTTLFNATETVSFLSHNAVFETINGDVFTAYPCIVSAGWPLPQLSVALCILLVCILAFALWKTFRYRRRYVDLRRKCSELESSIEKLKHDKARAELELHRFNYSVSHDLRSPLHALKGFSEALIEDYGNTFSGEAQDFLWRIFRASNRLDRYINILLTLSRISSTNLNFSEVEITQLADKVMQNIKEEYPNTSVNFSITAEERTVKADAALLEDLLTNLFDNAVKFSSAHTPAEVAFGSTGPTTFYISDNGVGFDMRYHEQMYDVFQTLHSQKESAGDGAGLAIARRIVHKHGGNIWAESEKDKGTVIYFSLDS